MSEHFSPGSFSTQPHGSGDPGPSGSAPSGSAPFGPAPFGSAPSEPGRGSLHRSRTDRKVAGLAGGIGRTLGIDPVLIRVALVVLTLFGGFGIVLYAVGWLVVPDDGDRVSAVQALLGRGRSSVSPALTVLLALIALGGAGTLLSVGVPFWPLLVAAGLIWWFRFSGHGGRRNRWNNHAERDARRWGARRDHRGAPADHWGEQARNWGERAESWVRARNWSSGCGSSASGRGAAWARVGRDAGDAAEGSPFSRPAFWDRPGSDAPGVRLTKEPMADRGARSTPGSGAAASPAGPDPLDPTAPRTTPPAWDPLGVAPFAWDLPEPTPLTPPTPTRRGGQVIARVTAGLSVLTMAAVSAALMAGGWSWPWARVTALGLAVVAVGMLIAALAGRGVRRLIVPAVILTVLTLGLSVTGLSGTSDYGDVSWAPTGAELQQEYTVQAGTGTLDLTGLTPAAGQTDTTRLTVRAGQATVRLPAGATVDLTCRVSAGQADCLGVQLAGVNRESSSIHPGTPERGALRVVVEVDGGDVMVRRG